MDTPLIEIKGENKKVIMEINNDTLADAFKLSILTLSTVITDVEVTYPDKKPRKAKQVLFKERAVINILGKSVSIYIHKNDYAYIYTT